MTHKHFGTLADVFKQVALGEMLQAIKPSEYWESHASLAFYDERGPTNERLHGVHFFAKAAEKSNILRLTLYHRLLKKGIRENGETVPLSRIPSSPAMAHESLGGNSRRRLFCDVEPQSLMSIKELGGNQQVVECVQEDGVTVTRGAVMLLPEPWPASTLAVIDPEEITKITEAGITPMELWCEMASRGVMAVLWYGFANGEERLVRHQAFHQALEKSRLTNRGIQRFEGVLKVPAANISGSWGFGSLTARLPGAALESVDQSLRALEALYAQAVLTPGMAPGSGAWTYSRSAM